MAFRFQSASPKRASLTFLLALLLVSCGNTPQGTAGPGPAPVDPAPSPKDTTGPVLQVTLSTERVEGNEAGAVTYRVDLQDPSGIGVARLYDNNRLVREWPRGTVGAEGSIAYTPADNGTHVLKLEATDLLGNASVTSRTVEVALTARPHAPDTTPPDATMEIGAWSVGLNGTTQSYVITALDLPGNDPDARVSGVASIRLYANDKMIREWDAPDPKVTGTIEYTHEQNGEQTLRAEVRDRAGNLTTVTSTYFVNIPVPCVVTGVSLPASLHMKAGQTASVAGTLQTTGDCTTQMIADQPLTWSSTGPVVVAAEGRRGTSIWADVTAQAAGAATVNVSTSTTTASLAVTVQPAESDPYDIAVQYLTPVTDAQRSIVVDAVRRWERVMLRGLPEYTLQDGTRIDDLRIDVSFVYLSGPAGVGGPSVVRQNAQGRWLPVTGQIRLDAALFANAQEPDARNGLINIVVHEIGHVLGIGTLWDTSWAGNDLVDCGVLDPAPYTGRQGLAQYRLFGGMEAFVPAQSRDEGRCGHWHQTKLNGEVMAPTVPWERAPISAITVGALADLGHEVDLLAADTFDATLRPQALQRPPLDLRGDVVVPTGPDGRPHR